MVLASIMSYLASLPRPVLLVLAAAMFGTAVRWQFRWTLLIDMALIALAIERLSIGMLVWAAVLIALRHVRAFADDIALMLDLDGYDGLTLRVGWLLLPGATPPANHYVPIAVGPTVALTPAPVHVPVPGTADTTAEKPPDRDITKEAWIDAMAAARDEKGKYLFSGNKIFEALGGHRATVMARVKEIQHGVPPAPFRQEDGTTAPATHPVTKEGT